MSIPRDNYIGEPGHPAPWTTRTPREGMRDADEARIISLAPDVCRSPRRPIPYPVVDFCGHDEGYTRSVRFTGQKAMVMRSNTSHVHGDEAGRGGGVVSGTVGGISEPISHAAHVRAEGSHVIRHLDRFYMNNRNTVGEAVFVRDTATFAAPEDDDPLPGSMVANAMPCEPYQVAQAATGTVSDAGGYRPTSRPAPARMPAPQLGLDRRGVLGLLLSDILHHGSMSDEARAAELRALEVINSSAGENIIREHRLMGGRQPVTSVSDIFDNASWDGKYGLIIQPEERIPLANDILGHLTGQPHDVRNLTDEDVRAILAGASQTLSTGEAQGVRISARESERHEVQCFEVSDRYDRDEYREQLKRQEEELNNMSPEEYLRRREAFRNGETVRGGRVQREMRRRWVVDREEKLVEEGYSRFEANQIANEEAGGLAALHALDLVAGGADIIWRMGDRGVNSSIGSKWMKKQRLDKLDEYAERIRGSQDKMDVALEDC